MTHEEGPGSFKHQYQHFSLVLHVSNLETCSDVEISLNLTVKN